MRLIDADAIPYEPLPKGDRNYRTYNLDDAYEDGYNDAMVDVRNSPTIEERKKGKWIMGKCDQCGAHAPFWPMASTYYESDYCPNCGSEMRGDDHETD